MATTAADSKAVARAFYEGYNTHDLKNVFGTYLSSSRSCRESPPAHAHRAMVEHNGKDRLMRPARGY